MESEARLRTYPALFPAPKPLGSNKTSLPLPEGVKTFPKPEKQIQDPLGSTNGFIHIKARTFFPLQVLHDLPTDYPAVMLPSAG